MSDPAFASLTVFGRFPPELVDEFARLVADEYVHHTLLEGAATVERMLDSPEAATLCMNIASHEVLNTGFEFHQDNKNYGRFSEIEDFLTQHRIAFHARWTHGDSFSAGAKQFRTEPDGITTMIWCELDDEDVPLIDVFALKLAIAKGYLDAEIARLERLTGVNLPAFVIAGELGYLAIIKERNNG